MLAAGADAAAGVQRLAEMTSQKTRSENETKCNDDALFVEGSKDQKVVLSEDETDRLVEQLVAEAVEEFGRMADHSWGHLSVALRSQVMDLEFKKFWEQTGVKVRANFRAALERAGQARSVGVVGLEIASGDLVTAGAGAGALEAMAIVAISTIVVNLAVQQYSSELSAEWKLCIQRCADVAGAVGIGGFALWEAGVAGACAWDLATGNAATVGLGASTVGCPFAMTMAAMNCAIMGYVSHQLVKKARARTISVSEGNTLQKHFGLSSRNVFLISDGDGDICKSILNHFIKEEKQVECFLKQTNNLPKLLKEKTGKRKPHGDYLEEFAKLVCIEIADGYFVWRFPLSMIQEAASFELLAFEAADVIVQVFKSDPDQKDIEVLTHPSYFLKTLAVKNVEHENNYEDFKEHLTEKIEDVVLRGKATQVQPNCIGLLGTNLHCPGGLALLSLLVPPKQSP